jgi:hypothetical protein
MSNKFVRFQLCNMTGLITIQLDQKIEDEKDIPASLGSF